MAIELKQTVKLSQQLLITPQLQQAIKLLQLSRAELIETVQKELLENPVLEENDDRPSVETTENGPMAETERVSDLNTSSEPDIAPEPGIEAADPRSMSKEFDWGNFRQIYHCRKCRLCHQSQLSGNIFKECRRV